MVLGSPSAIENIGEGFEVSRFRGEESERRRGFITSTVAADRNDRVSVVHCVYYGRERL